jgi:hypothetical protein
METDSICDTQVYVKVNEEGAKDSSIHDEARAFFKKMEDGKRADLANSVTMLIVIS